MKKKTYYLAAWIFIILGFISLLVKSVASIERFTVIILGCFIVGLVYLILGYQQRD